MNTELDITTHRIGSFEKLIVRVFLSLLLFTFSFNSFAQVTFNTIYPPGNNEPNLIIQDSSYVVLQQGNPETDQLHKIYFDSHGNYQRTDTIQMSAFYEDCKGCLEDFTGGYFKAGTYFYSNDSADVIIIKLDKDLDLVKTVTYSYNGDRTSDAMGLYFNDNKIFLLGEYLLETTANYSGLLVCLDSNLNVLWERKYSLPSLNSKGGLRTTNAISTKDKGLMIGGYYLRRNPYLLRGLIIKTDSLGNEEWRKYLDGKVQNDEVFLQALPNGNVLYACAVSDINAALSGNAFSKLRVGEIDTAGNIIWENLIGKPSLFMRIYYFLKTTDSNYVIGGYGSTYNFSSFLQNINTIGDSLWFRTISHADSLANEGHLQVAIETSDQGFLLGGYYEDFGLGGTGVNTWLVKTDKFGCVQIGCQSIDTRDFQASQNLVSVFPNPSSDFVLIKTDEMTFNFHVFDTAGRKYKSGTSRKDTYRLDVSDLKEGIYLIDIKFKMGSQYLTLVVQ